MLWYDIQVQFWVYNGPWPAMLISPSLSPNTCFVWQILWKHSCDIIFGMFLVWAGKKVGIERPLSVLWLHERFLNIPNKKTVVIYHAHVYRAILWSGALERPAALQSHAAASWWTTQQHVNNAQMMGPHQAAHMADLRQGEHSSWESRRCACLWGMRKHKGTWVGLREWGASRLFPGAGFMGRSAR